MNVQERFGLLPFSDISTLKIKYALSEGHIVLGLNSIAMANVGFSSFLYA